MTNTFTFRFYLDSNLRIHRPVRRLGKYFKHFKSEFPYLKLEVTMLIVKSCLEHYKRLKKTLHGVDS